MSNFIVQNFTSADPIDNVVPYSLNKSRTNIEPNEGYKMLEQSNFSEAFLFFDYMIHNGSNLSAAYWGMLLATHQCKNNAELVALGIPISKEHYYSNAFEYGNTSERESYSQISTAILVKTHLHILNLISENNNKYILNKWLKHYKDSVSNDNDLLSIQQWFLNNTDNKTLDPEYPGVLQKMFFAFNDIFNKYCKDKTGTPSVMLLSSILNFAVEYTKNEFISVMNTIYDNISKPITNTAPKHKENTPALFKDIDAYNNYLSGYKSFLEKKGIKFFSEPESPTSDCADKKKKYTYEQVWTQPTLAYSEKNS